ncbi:MAG: hypothetical protein NZM26_04275 [Patescibacteria group bacterium]|nr:hypothetical protein [Patescibacteria group bacterium]
MSETSEIIDKPYERPISSVVDQRRIEMLAKELSVFIPSVLNVDWRSVSRVDKKGKPWSSLVLASSGGMTVVGAGLAVGERKSQIRETLGNLLDASAKIQANVGEVTEKANTATQLMDNVSWRNLNNNLQEAGVYVYNNVSRVLEDGISGANWTVPQDVIQKLNEIREQVGINPFDNEWMLSVTEQVLKGIDFGNISVLDETTMGLVLAGFFCHLAGKVGEFQIARIVNKNKEGFRYQGNFPKLISGVWYALGPTFGSSRRFNSMHLAEIAIEAGKIEEMSLIGALADNRNLYSFAGAKAVSVTAELIDKLVYGSEKRRNQVAIFVKKVTEKCKEMFDKIKAKLTQGQDNYGMSVGVISDANIAEEANRALPEVISFEPEQQELEETPKKQESNISDQSSSPQKEYQNANVPLADEKLEV